jgi:homoserine kinase
VRVTVRVPATSANLGPGFDCFGLALDVCNEVTVDTEAEPGVTWDGEDADELPTDGTDMISRAIAYTLEQKAARYPDASLPPFALHGLNRIPLARGLGSSAAAAVAGVTIARALLGPAGDPPVDKRGTAALASIFEGHGDNASAAALGGFTIGPGPAYRFDLHPDVNVAIVVPRHLRLPTDQARSVVPDEIRRFRAVFNIGHASLMAIALTQDPDLIMDAIQDQIHEAPRLALLPDADRVHRLLSGSIPTCLSGAGPSLLAFEIDGRAVPDDLGDGWEVWRPGINTAGVEFSDED